MAVAGFVHAMRGMQADLKYSMSLWVQSAYGLHATAACPALSNAPSASTQTGAVGCREFLVSCCEPTAAAAVLCIRAPLSMRCQVRRAETSMLSIQPLLGMLSDQCCKTCV